MVKDLDDYFEKGILFPAFEALMNFEIWNNIADEFDFFETCDDSTKRLYSFIQESAITNIILSISKMLDNEKNHPTRCIDGFFKLLMDRNNSLSVIEDYNTIQLLEEYGFPKNVIESIKIENFKNFNEQFASFYTNKMKVDNIIYNKIKDIKILRDKIIVHNEVFPFKSINLDDVEPLLKFVFEIVSIYGIAYKSTGFYYSRSKVDAENAAFFIKENIEKLKLKVD